MQALLVTAYFPPVNYMADAIRADEIVIEAHETYTKQTCRNHCLIFGPNGRHSLSIPVIKANGNHTITRDILISDDQPWQKVHWRSIETAYNNSPFFLYYQDNFVIFFEKKYKFLLDLNMEILRVLLQLFKVTLPLRTTEKYEKSHATATDLRSVSGLNGYPGSSQVPHYTQVFEPRHGFLPGLSILDAIFNLGPEARRYLESVK